MKKVVIAMLVFLISMPFLMAGGSSESADDVVTVTWYASRPLGGEIDTAIREIAEDYSQEMGGKWKLEVETTADRPSYLQKLKTLIAGGNMPDIIDIDADPYCQELVDAGRVTVHPCVNTATVLLATKDLIGLLREHGCTVRVVDLSPFARRRLTDEDLPALLALCETNPTYYELYGERPTLENLAQALRELPPGCRADQKEFLGFSTQGKLVAIMDIVCGYPDERAAYVGLLMIDGAQHGCGIGTRIMRDELRRLQAKGFSRVRLAYIQGNEPARSFWTKLGFEPTGEIVSTPHYVAVPMERAI